MPKRSASSNLADGLTVEPQNNGNEAIELAAKKKRKGESTAKIVTASGRKLDLKKSKKIQERLQKKAEKLSKNRRRELKQIEERKKQKLTRAELIAGLQEFQLDQLTSASIHSTVERKAKKTAENLTPNFPKKLRAVSGKAKETERPKLQDELQHYETGSSCTESEGELEDVKRSEKIETQIPTIETIREQNRVDFPERLDVANEQEPKEKISNDQSFYQLLSKIKGEKIGVSRLEAMEKQRSQLPIYAEEQSIVETINDNTVTIISGETGSGKTTQLPQFLYEAGYTSHGHLIGVTEPRRVAAMSMSERVGYELNDPECSSYQIRFEGNRTDKTKILFMTDGVLLKELQTDVKLSKFSVILIDEAHERSMYSDVLIGLLSRICIQRAKSGVPLKLVIMSATLRLTDFMQQRLFPSTLPKLLSVDSRQFPVTVHFERRTPDDYMKAAFNKVCKIHDRLPDGAILVFVSGQKEVHRLVKLLSRKYPLLDKKRTKQLEVDMIEMERDERMFLELDDLDAADCVGEDGKDESDEFELKEEMEKTSKPLYCLPLYSMMPSFLQRRVFEPVPEGQRLCVVATNVAETSLTIPNVRYVVDSGKEKRRDFDPITGVSQFNVNWCSQASANQRSGRAGRVAAGHAYRLFSSAVYEDFAKFPPPEILHKPVDQMVLHLKSMNIRKISNFPFPTPPEADQVAKAEERLEKLGALSRKSGEDVPSITSLGKTLLVFPLAPHFSKILVLSIQNGVLPLVSTLVSALSVREPLINVAGLEGSDNAETQNLVTIREESGTLFGQSKRLGDLNVLLCALNEAEKNQVSDRSEATKFGLRYEALKEIRKMRKQLLQLVDGTAGLKKMSEQNGNSTEMIKWTDAEIGKIRQIFVSCQSDQIAKRVANSELVPKGAYQTQLLEEFVFIDPTSTLYKEEPEFVLYQELVQLNDRKLMQNVSEVEAEWLSNGLMQRLIRRARQFVRSVSSTQFKLPQTVLPSDEFLGQLNDKQRDKLAKILVEMEAIYAFNPELPQQLNSKQWDVLLKKTIRIEDREEYLRQIHSQQKHVQQIQVENERRQKLIADQKRRIQRGEMIYGRGFIEPMAIRGADFRRLIDAYYGHKLLSRKRLEGGVPEFRVDCQNLRLLSTVWIQKALNDLQELYTDNWTSREPLPIRFHSYFPDNEIAEIAKRSLTFLHGPRRGEEQENDSTFTPHPFSPTVTRKDILDDLPPDVTKDQVIYISTIAHHMLDRETLHRSKVIVLHAFPEHLLPHPNIKVLRQRLMKENIKVYRLPVEAEMKWERGHKSQWASVNAAILRQMLTSESSWQDAFLSHIPSWHFEEETQKAEQKFEYVLSPYWSAKAQAPKTEKPKEKRVHKHRYSREERNRMRKEAAG
ncbi:putative ATP-dependent RNA helicase kurz [Aphelenchoides besseyi]|nr:putative ATP-dependent RNA helicase kurz [Aphelenchoides besseyi]